MKQLSSSQIRTMFLAFFKEKDHQVEPSASLIPKNDPTLLWINSGVATLKKYFDGTVIPENPRLVNVQKSIRTNDIENVGFTARHHTFFEMLGNFSIGDYFKKEAIEWAWEFLTSKQWIGFNKDLLSVTIHPDDDEAYDIWLNDIKIPSDRIIRLEENFWDIGVGPSGPNTEIFYDRGEKFGNDPNDPELFPGGENERYLEIWNLVFSQFNHNPNGSYTPLPKKNIDTGMGLERVVSIIQDVPTNFETDLFLPLIKEIEKLASTTYGSSTSNDTAFKVIADHVRTVAFAVGDGALPSNEGRGYVLRRLLRRAVRFAIQIGIDKPFMYKLVTPVGNIMEDFYPEVVDKSDFIQNIIKLEEERFHETLHDGLEILTTVMKKEKEKNSTILPGVEVFKLYDTYGFPKELTEEYVSEEGFSIDEEGFFVEMAKQQDRARNARKQTDSMHIQNEILGTLETTSLFVGYEQQEIKTTIATIIKDNRIEDSMKSGEDAILILDKTPFYAESGGQVADLGRIYSDSAVAEIKDVATAPKGQHLHYVHVQEGAFEVGQKVTAVIDKVNRSKIVKNHTATHLLHQALRDILGDHVTQAGSLVTDDHLRFDFTHFQSVSDEELKKIEQMVNEKIFATLPVIIATMPIDAAKEMGAMALFGEKYGDQVRVVQVDNYSVELCGGCHVKNTSEINLFNITSESGIGAGTRRIEAVTGKKAYTVIQEKMRILQTTAIQLKSNEEHIPKRISGLLEEINQLKRANHSLSAKLSNLETSSIQEQVQVVDDVTLLSQKVNASDMNQLRNMVDDLKQSLGSSVVLLAAESNNKVLLSAGITQDLIDRGLHAGKLIKQVAEICDGGGGGRPDMAQAGGKEPQKIEKALKYAKSYVSDNIR